MSGGVLGWGDGVASVLGDGVGVVVAETGEGSGWGLPIPGGLNLAGHREIIMRPDGIQLILSQMKTPPAPGDTLPLRLIFLNAGTLNLDVRVHPPDQEFPPIIHRGHKP